MGHFCYVIGLFCDVRGLFCYVAWPDAQGKTGSGADRELRAVVFREAESKFPAAAWSKYDLNVTYSARAQVPEGFKV